MSPCDGDACETKWRLECFAFPLIYLLWINEVDNQREDKRNKGSVGDQAEGIRLM